MSGLALTITNAGRAALVNAANTGTNAVTIAEIGLTASAFTASPTTTSIPAEIKRLTTFSGAAVAADTLHIAIRDDTDASYTLRGFGLYLNDGTLFALYSQTSIIMQKSVNAMLLLQADIRLLQVAASSITFGNANFLNPPATTATQGVIEIATNDEAVAGTDHHRAVTPSRLKLVLDTRFGDTAPTAFTKALLAKTSASPVRAHLKLKSAALKDEGAGNNLDADKLDGQHGTYYLAWANQTGKPGAFPPSAHSHPIAGVIGLETALNEKLDGIKIGPADISERIDSGFYQTLNVGAGWPDQAANQWWHLIAHTHSNPSNYHSMQFACRFGDDELRFRTTKNNGNAPWHQMWHSGNFNPATKFNKTGGTVDGNVTVKSQHMIVKAPSAGTNVHYWLNDENNTPRGLLFWSRESDHIVLRRYNADNAVEGELRFLSDGAVAFQKNAIMPRLDIHSNNDARLELKTLNQRHFSLVASGGNNLGFYDIPGNHWLLRIDATNKAHFAGEVKATGFDGNASSATKLKDTRTINGVNFNGTANIITSRWGAERTLKIGNQSMAVNGSANVEWSLADIGAAPASHPHIWNNITGKPATATRWPTYSEVTDKPAAFPPSAHSHPIAGVIGLETALNEKLDGIKIGPADISERIDSGFYQTLNVGAGWPDQAANQWWHLIAHTHSNPSSYHSMQFACRFGDDELRFRTTKNNGNAPWHQMWHSGNFNPATKFNKTGGTVDGPLSVEHSSITLKSAINTGNLHYWLRDENNARRGLLCWNRADNNLLLRSYNEDGSETAAQLQLSPSGKAHFTGEVKATGFDGNASSATKLQTARTLKIGNTGKSFDGTENLTWSPADIGYSSSKNAAGGWMKRPDGMIEQWGMILQPISGEVSFQVTFPIGFPNACLNIVTTEINNNTNNAQFYDNYSQVKQNTVTKTNFSVFLQGPGGSHNWQGMYWRAIGY